MPGRYRKRKGAPRTSQRGVPRGDEWFKPDPNFNPHEHIRQAPTPLRAPRTALQRKVQDHIKDLYVMLNDPRCPQDKDELRARIADLEQHANKRVEPVLPTPEPPTPDRRPRAPKPPPPEPEWAPDDGWMHTTSSTMFTGGFGGGYGSKFKSKEDTK